MGTTKRAKTKNPIAVVISDIHYNLQTLPVADACLRQAVAVANQKEVPLIIAGDLHDTKANLRGECVSAILNTLDLCKYSIYVLVGNHDKINEKSQEDSLDFLRKSVSYLIREPQYFDFFDAWFIPYQHDPEAMRQILRQIPDNSRLVIHQGRAGSEPGIGHYDKSALSAADYAPFKVISGHYHEYQSFDGFTYVGNPYTLDFSEADHKYKGFLLLNEDFSFTQVMTCQRKHVVCEYDYDRDVSVFSAKPGPEDITLVKYSAPKKILTTLTKESVAKQLGLKTLNFRLDLIPADSDISEIEFSNNRTASSLFMSAVDSLSLEQEEANRAKALWDEKDKK